MAGQENLQAYTEVIEQLNLAVGNLHGDPELLRRRVLWQFAHRRKLLWMRNRLAELVEYQSDPAHKGGYQTTGEITRHLRQLLDQSEMEASP